MSERPIPPWACKSWGDWEHDWLDCYLCIEAYERWQDNDVTPETMLSSVDHLCIRAIRLHDGSLRIGTETISEWPADFTFNGVRFAFGDEEHVGTGPDGKSVQGFYFQQESQK